jgi:hypothetical protein
MSLPSPEIEELCLTSRLDTATKHATDMGERAVQVSVDISKEKTQYFEKIALASAGTIALVVSFVGSHAGRLQPPWLLRSALIVLVLAMITAMYRNLKYPYYLMACYSKQNYSAMRHREQCRLELLLKFPDQSLKHGKPIDVQETKEQFGKVDKGFEDEIAKFQEQETSVFNLLGWIERGTLTLVGSSSISVQGGTAGHWQQSGS